MTVATGVWHIWQHRQVENPYHVEFVIHRTPYRDVINISIHHEAIKPNGIERYDDVRFSSVYGYAVFIYQALGAIGADADNTDYMHILDNLSNIFAEEGI